MDEQQRYVVLRPPALSMHGGAKWEVDDREPPGWREVAFVMKEEDAYRITACLNACEGISTDELNAGVIEDAIERLEIVSGFLEYVDGDVDLFTGDWDVGAMRFVVSHVLKRMKGQV